MVRVHSFDVFDTCLARRSAIPSGVLYEVARKVFAKLGVVASRSLEENFVAARIGAEHRARRESSREDVTLDEIWKILAGSMGWKDGAGLAVCELEAEGEWIVGISAMREQVEAARRQGNRIVFLSDMYLPTEFVKGLLIRHRFAEDGDGFYVSGEVGKTKISGNLFRHMLERERVTAAQVVHMGDNAQTDFAMPRRLGIEATLFKKSAMTPTELHVMKTGCHSPEMARMAGAMRVFRLERETSVEEMTEVLSQFIAPFIMGFAVWVLQKAQEDGIKRLYFLSRDCQVVFKVARELAAQFGGIECRYLYVSRQSLFLASADAASPEKMPWMRKDFEAPILKSLLAKIDLTYEDVAPFLGGMAGEEREAYCLASEADWGRFWAALHEKPVQAQLDELMAERRKTTRQYLEGEGMLDSVPWALVDFGWYLSCQKAMTELLKNWGRSKPVQGYYIGLGRQRFGPAEAGQAAALFYQTPEDFPSQRDCNGIFARIPLIEHIVGCADHPTVHHYEAREGGDVGPAFVKSVDEPTMTFCRKLHRGVLDFVASNPQLVDDFRDENISRDLMSRLQDRFFQAPTTAQLRALAGLSLAVDQNGLFSVPIARPLTVGTALIPLLPQKTKFFAPLVKYGDSFWAEGDLALSSEGVKLLAGGVRRLVKLRTKILRAIFPR